MDLNPPKRKKTCKLPKPSPLPLIKTKSNDFYKFKGIFNGFTVTINDLNEMKNLISMGSFGKGNLSRSYPKFDENLEIIRKRQLKNRKLWNEKFQCNKNNIKKLIVVPDSDNDDEDYFKNLQPIYEIDKTGTKEIVNLMLEEAYFLHKDLKILEITTNEENLLNSIELWKLFNEIDSNFYLKYIGYYHFRSKNWVVKPGIKFGGDFLLYKEGPPFYHASYVVLIRNDMDFDTTSLMGLQRMCETSGKELLICQIKAPEIPNLDDIFKNVTIKEILMKRWVSSQER